MVEHFVAAVSLEVASTFQSAMGLCSSVLKRLKARSQPVVHEQLLVSSPGFGILDSGCGKTIIGRDTFEEFKKHWTNQNVPAPTPFAETSHFRFGNGARETSHEAVKLPVVIAGRSGTIYAALVQGRAPLLISRRALQALRGQD